MAKKEGGKTGTPLAKKEAGKEKKEEEGSVKSSASEKEPGGKELGPTQSEEVLKASFMSKLAAKQWTGGKQMPGWAQEGLARDLSKLGREQRKKEDADLKQATDNLPKGAIENNPSIRSRADEMGLGDEEKAARKQKRKAETDLRRVRSQTKIEAFRSIFKFRTRPFTQDELDTAACHVANKGNMLGVRALASMIYATNARTPSAGERRVEKMTAEGAKVVFSPYASLDSLVDDPIRQKLYAHSTVEENTLYNNGITLRAPTDKPPAPKPTIPRVSFNNKYSIETYDPAQPDDRNKGYRTHRPLVTDKLPPPMPQNLVPPPPPHK